jgi:hypothetical protein
MIQKVFAGLCFFQACFSFAFDWPVETKVLYSTFGGNDGKHFRTGIELGGSEQSVFPIAEGEVIFFFEEGTNYQTYQTVPRGYGSFVVLQHEGDIQSVYANLAPGSFNPENKRLKTKPLQIPQDLVEKLSNQLKAAPETGSASSHPDRAFSKEEQAIFDRGLVKAEKDYLVSDELSQDERTQLWNLLCKNGLFACLGRTGRNVTPGSTGTTTDASLFLTVFDVKEDLILNPIHKNAEKTLLSPPLEPGRNTSSPLIKQIFLKRGEQLTAITENQIIPSGEAELIVQAYSSRTFFKKEHKMAPFRLSLIVSGREITSIDFYALEERNNELAIWKTNIKCQELYADEWLYKLAKLTLVEGNILLQIKIEDFFGLETASDYHLKVSS